MKKRKLNSNNPKYKKKKEKKYKRILMKDNDKFKMYFLWEIKQ